MVYKPNIPQSDDIISISQVDMRSNFSSLDSIWGKTGSSEINVGDHVSFTEPKVDDRGSHKKLTLLTQDAAPTTLVNEIGLYSKKVGSSTELFYRRELNTGDYQLTSNQRVLQNTLRLSAFVMFTYNGKILSTEQIIDGKKTPVEMSYNILSIELEALKQTRKINFKNSLLNNNYIWNLSSFLSTSNRLICQPKNNINGETYDQIVNASFFRVQFSNLSGSAKNADIILFQAYEVI